jgi:hypothetical protein
MRRNGRKGHVLSAALAMIAAAALLPQAALADTVTTVTGTCASGTAANMVYLSTDQGTMIIKLDSGTKFTGCSGISVGKSLTVDVYRGSDAYMHASKVTDAAKSSTSGTSASSSSSDSTKSTTKVSGKIGESTTEDMLHLETAQGEMLIKIDSSTDLSKCKLLLKDRAVTVAVYRGDDAYMHAASIEAGETKPVVTIDKSNAAWVSGTVKKASSTDILVLKTSAGDMQIKLDDTTDYSSVSSVIAGQEIQVKVARGDDAYMHALSIKPVEKTSSSSDSTSSSKKNTTKVTGTLTDASNEDTIYIDTGYGTMKVRMDGDTDTSSLGTIRAGKKVAACVYRADDAYMHAVKVERQ